MDKHIVFLDDDETFLLIAEARVKRHPVSKKFKTEFFRHPEKLKLHCKITDITLAIIDLFMEVESGLEVADAIRGDVDLIWCYTGMSEHYINDERVKHIDRFVHKDVSFVELLDDIYEHIE